MTASPKKRAAIGAHSVFDQPRVVETPAEPKRGTVKDGRVMLPFYVPKAARYQLRLMALEADSTQQDMMTEALNDFFVKHGKSPIA
jgi:hypothetical protein